VCGAAANLDGCAPDLDPVVAGIQEFEAEFSGAERRRDLEDEARVRQAEAAAVAFLHVLMRQAEDAEVRAAGADGADIGEDSFRLGEEPAGDPGGFAVEDPLGGLFDIEDVGVVLVHAGQRGRGVTQDDGGNWSKRGAPGGCAG